MSSEEVLERRRRLLGPGLRLSYRQPLRLESATGVWLTDSDGIEYLDAYNNVPHVGHGRREVLDALDRQAERLNTNTRYLVDIVLDCAERLTGLLPNDLDVMLFANSGSEANDLAWRIARTVTKRSGMIVTDNAYHGATDLTMATSPEELRPLDMAPPQWVATIDVPTAFEQGAHPALEDAFDHLGSLGHQPAAFACDTVFSSDGIFDTPPGWFADAAATARDRGGLFIADEVQAGLGRVGPRLWGFATDDAVPDIVTLGKPLGNGHPVAAVVTSSRILEEFDTAGYYFSTFAGNPVSAAAVMAVIDVMEAEALPQRAGRVGDYLRTGIRELAARHPIITDVRGPGLFVGAEIGGDSPGGAAERIVEEMKERRVLIGRTGVLGNVLKIRPPLVFDEANADVLLDALAGTLSLL